MPKETTHRRAVAIASCLPSSSPPATSAEHPTPKTLMWHALGRGSRGTAEHCAGDTLTATASPRGLARAVNRSHAAQASRTVVPPPPDWVRLEISRPCRVLGLAMRPVTKSRKKPCALPNNAFVEASPLRRPRSCSVNDPAASGTNGCSTVCWPWGLTTSGLSTPVLKQKPAESCRSTHPIKAKLPGSSVTRRYGGGHFPIESVTPGKLQSLTVRGA